MIIRGFVDESYAGSQSRGLFTLACVLVRQETLAWFEMAWQNVLDKTNVRLREQNRSTIKRFHATELNGGNGQFKGWTPEERVDLAKKLIRVIRYHRSFHMALTMELSDLLAEWPEISGDPIAFAYRVFITQFMIDLGRIFEQERMSERIELVVERGAGFVPMHAGFQEVMENETFRYRRFFVSIREGSWDSDVLLQVADLFSYEAYKDAQRREEQADQPRKSMEALLELDSVGIRTRKVTREAIAEMKRLHEERVAGEASAIQNRP